MSVKSPIVLCILDGWGYRDGGDDNSILQAMTPNWDKLWSNSPHCLLHASGESVGLPKGQMGNSEVGHVTLGSGRIVYQDLPRIDHAIEDQTLPDIPEMVTFIQNLKATEGSCHLLGLFSPGGIHAHHRHILALADIFLANHIPVVFHPFLDGRDMPPQSARPYLEELMEYCGKHARATIGSVGGRYYAMDRDQRWERIELAYNALVLPTAVTPIASTPLDVLEHAYQMDITDEFVSPTAMEGYEGMRDGDGFLMANFRADRARQITEALLNPHFNAFHRIKTVDFAAAMGMIEYSLKHTIWMTTLFPLLYPFNTLGEIISQNDLKQLRAAETEKYAHVTFFFNGGREEPFPGEERILIPSPQVSTYDLKPEMSASELTFQVTKAIESNKYDLIVLNYANPDMLGHTGKQKETQSAIETVDVALGSLMSSIDKVNGVLLVTADHGNAETMRSPDMGTPHTAHTLNPVPFTIYGHSTQSLLLRDGSLADVAPTVLQLLNIPKPSEMSGLSLIK